VGNAVHSYEGVATYKSHTVAQHLLQQHPRTCSCELLRRQADNGMASLTCSCQQCSSDQVTAPIGSQSHMNMLTQSHVRTSQIRTYNPTPPATATAQHSTSATSYKPCTSTPWPASSVQQNNKTNSRQNEPPDCSGCWCVEGRWNSICQLSLHHHFDVSRDAPCHPSVLVEERLTGPHRNLVW
jgi:hypothetical protein